MELARLGDWQAKVMIKETEIHKVKVGQPVNLFVNAFPHMEYKIFEGVVTEIAAQPVSANPSQEIKVYPVKITISNPKVEDVMKTLVKRMLRPYHLELGCVEAYGDGDNTPSPTPAPAPSDTTTTVRFQEHIIPSGIR